MQGADCPSLAGCAGNVRDSWKQLDEWAESEDGRSSIKAGLQLCPTAKLDCKEDVDDLAQWLQNAFDFLVIC